MIKNEQIKAFEVLLTGVNGEDLGVVRTSEALLLARKLKVDLICTSLMSSPPPCKLIGASVAKQQMQSNKAKDHVMKIKELRLTAHIEEHDYDTKRNQAERMLLAGDAVLFVVRIQGKEGEAAKRLLEKLIAELKPFGIKQSGIQLSGKQAMVQLNPSNSGKE